MKKFEEWLRERDKDLYAEVNWKGLAQSAALAGSMMMPGSADASPYKPTPQGQAAVQKFADVMKQADTNPIVVNKDGSVIISSYGANIKEAKKRAQNIFAGYMNEKFAKMGLQYKKNAFISKEDQQINVIVSQPLPERKGFVFQVKVRVNSYRDKPDENANPIPLK